MRTCTAMAFVTGVVLSSLASGCSSGDPYTGVWWTNPGGDAGASASSGSTSRGDGGDGGGGIGSGSVGATGGAEDGGASGGGTAGFGSGADGPGTGAGGSSGGGAGDMTGGGGAQDDAGAGSSDAGFTVFGDAAVYRSQSGCSGEHNAGRNCLQCHDRGGSGLQFTFAGTVYDPSGSAISGVEVRVVDATGNATSVHSCANGNFYYAGSTLSGPAHVGARNASGSDDMLETITTGACNGCHCTGSGCTTVRVHVP